MLPFLIIGCTIVILAITTGIRLFNEIEEKEKLIKLGIYLSNKQKKELEIVNEANQYLQNKLKNLEESFKSVSSQKMLRDFDIEHFNSENNYLNKILKETKEENLILKKQIEELQQYVIEPKPSKYKIIIKTANNGQIYINLNYVKNNKVFLSSEVYKNISFLKRKANELANYLNCQVKEDE